MTHVTPHQLETVLDSVLDSNSSHQVGGLLARRVLYSAPKSFINLSVGTGNLNSSAQALISDFFTGLPRFATSLTK